MVKHSKKSRKTSILGAGIIFLLLIYIGIFAYLNLAKYAQHVDSDIAAEALLAREIWQEKTLTPDNWISSTERRIFAMPAVAALFYGITGSMQRAVGIACVLIGAVFFGVFYFFLRKLGLSPVACLTGVLMICALPINGIRNEGQLVPFVTLLLYLFAEYYVFHCMLLFFSILFYLHLKEKAIKQQRLTYRDAAAWIVLFGSAALLSLGGQRCLQMVTLPLVIYEIITLFLDSDGFTRKPIKGRLLPVLFVSTYVLAFVISLLYDRQANYTMYLQAPGEMMNRALITVPAALLEGFGIAGQAKVGSLSSLMQLLTGAFLALAVYGMVYILKRKKNALSKKREALLMLLTSLGVTAVILCITTAEPAHNYLMVSWFAAILAVVSLWEDFRDKKSLFADIILAAVFVFAVLNLKYTWYPAVTTTDNLQEYQEVADFLAAENIAYGYGEFWDAERISLINDGQTTMGHSYVMEDLRMYWWLTSTQWYPPALPQEMETAYVVRIPKKAAFEAQFSQDTLPRLQFENEKFAVYVSDRNLIKMQ